MMLANAKQINNHTIHSPVLSGSYRTSGPCASRTNALNHASMRTAVIVVHELEDASTSATSGTSSHVADPNSSVSENTGDP